MAAVLKRELGSYFRSPIGYTIIAIFYFFANIFFNMYCLSRNSGNMSSVFQNTFLIVLFIIPIITMKIFSEDKKLGTDKLLLTSPVSTGRIVFGKYLSAMIIYVICLLIFVVHGLIIASCGGFSCCGAQGLGCSVFSSCSKVGLSSCGLQALE